MSKTIYFIDMDGVLARYERHAYDPSKGPAPNVALYEHEDSHYFATCEADNNAVSLLKSLLANPDAEVYVLTHVAPHIPWASDDKREWLLQIVPVLDTATQLIIADSDKAETIMVREKLKGLNRNMVLIDDYNKNLNDWRDAGGTAIKYLNGINSSNSWDGLIIDGRIPGLRF